ncbi:class I SAM-dependent methyltransferase [Paenisporosarcina antarctica]|uniref:Class I SAM-dependent methyltransferase n=1 Tax=Paenisporosarcina antarctica TaxID=417367 RepID=A0A4P6ZYR5_9BACL|nr:class I SAM-dependent methyltransferase [Paenisporosarcina antarctica]QBP40656.1 class I SAM-dependent methyltransferase [Paenisporosarcina antarctica]
MNSSMERLFTFIDEHAIKLKTAEDLTYIEGVLETTEMWLDGEIEPDIQNVLKEDIRKAIQLAILKGMKQHVQAHHQMTPDSLGLLVGYFVDQLTKDKQHLSILDPAVGTGNLLFTVLNFLEGKATSSAVEIDDMLIRLAASTGDLLQQPVTLYRQDALQPLLIDPVDVVISDLPVGHYPDDKTASDYELKAKEGMSFSHHLMIEQSIRHTVDGGYLVFIVPQGIFESQQAKELHAYFSNHAWIQAVIQLPVNLFKNEAHAKSILILQKKSIELKQPKQVLLAKVPNMSNKDAMSLFFEKVNMWRQENMN